MPRLLLLNPSSRQDAFLFPPIGLDSLAAHTPPGWTIQAVDENLERFDPTQVDVDLVAMGAFTVQATRAFRLARTFRKRGIPVVMGGIHASVEPDTCGAEVDAVVTGEAEPVWAQVLADAERGALRPRYQATESVDLATAPPPNRRWFGDRYPRFGTIEASRGCPFACEFCSIGGFRKRSVRHKPIPHVIAELHRVRQSQLVFVDDNFAGYSQSHRDYAKDLSVEILRRGPKKRWVVMSSAQIAKDGALLDAMRRAGCLGVLLGFEQVGRPNGSLHKAWLDPYELREVAGRIAAAGLAVWGSFLVGQDDHDAAYLHALEEAVVDSPLHFLSIHRYTALPGTPVYTRARAEGRLLHEDPWDHWDHCDFTHHTMKYRHFTPAELDAHIDRIHLRFYSPRRLARRVRQLWGAGAGIGDVNAVVYGSAKEWIECRRERAAHRVALAAGRPDVLGADPRVRRLARATG